MDHAGRKGNIVHNLSGSKVGDLASVIRKNIAAIILKFQFLCLMSYSLCTSSRGDHYFNAVLLALYNRLFGSFCYFFFGIYQCSIYIQHQYFICHKLFILLHCYTVFRIYFCCRRLCFSLLRRFFYDLAFRIFFL